MSNHYDEDRDAYELDKAGGYYTRHVVAMTKEGLHSKSDIAAELAHRDYEIDKLKAQVEHLRSAIRGTIAKWEGVKELEATLYVLMRFYNKTEEQCLAEIRAQAVEAAVEATASNKYSLPLRDASDLYEYANQLRALKHNG